MDGVFGRLDRQVPWPWGWRALQPRLCPQPARCGPWIRAVLSVLGHGRVTMRVFPIAAVIRPVTTELAEDAPFGSRSISGASPPGPGAGCPAPMRPGSESRHWTILLLTARGHGRRRGAFGVADHVARLDSGPRVSGQFLGEPPTPSGQWDPTKERYTLHVRLPGAAPHKGGARRGLLKFPVPLRVVARMSVALRDDSMAAIRNGRSACGPPAVRPGGALAATRSDAFQSD
jgi:hypothetical protein